MNLKYRINNFTAGNFLQLLFILLPYTLIFSIFLTEVILLFLTFFYLRDNFSNLDYLIKKNQIIKLLLCFYLISIISTIYNYYDIKILFKNIVYIRFIFYALTISWIINKYTFSKKLFLYSLFSSYVILFFGSIYEFAIKRNCVTFTESNVAIFNNNFLLCTKKFFIGNLIRSDRISSFFGDEMIVGSFVSRLLPLLCLLILDQFKKNKLDKILLTSSLIITIIIVILSGERVSLFYIFLFLLILIFFVNLKFKILYLISFLIVSVLIINSSVTLKERFFQQTFEQIFSSNINDKKITFFSIQHESHAISALKMFYDNPILGVGPKKFRYDCKKKEYNANKNQPKDFSCSTHPHNFYVQLLAETGILGLIIPIFLFFNILKFFLRNIYYKLSNQLKKIDLKEICLYSCFLITLFPGLPTGNIFNNWLCIMFYIPLGFYIKLKRK